MRPSSLRDGTVKPPRSCVVVGKKLALSIRKMPTISKNIIFSLADP